MTCYMLSDINRRTENQDYCRHMEIRVNYDSTVRGMAVADGMGGMTDGKVASDTVVKEIQQAYLDFDLNKSLPRQLIQALYRANDAVWNKLKGSGGSTAVLGYIINDHLYFSSVGDSYIWILHDRIITRMNRSHNDLNKRRQECFSKGEIFLSNTTFTNGPKALTNFIGMPQLLGTDTLLQPLPLAGKRIRGFIVFTQSRENV